jgi:hypothetical protein
MKKARNYTTPFSMGNLSSVLQHAFEGILEIKAKVKNPSYSILLCHAS